SGVTVAVAIYLQMDLVVPFASVANLFFPTLLAGVDTGQASNASPALRVIIVSLFMMLVLLLDIWLQQLGLPRVSLLDIL
ncbi:MAG: hypothetical protein ACRDBG_15535, partial [Waterburya sp.]